MSRENKVLWTEGLFIKPAHFQQNDRYFESYINKVRQLSGSYAWGFDELTIDSQLLDQGKIAIRSASGIMPDGTPFNIPEEDPAPAPIDLKEGVINQPVYLCLPIRSTEVEVFYPDSEKGLQRYTSKTVEANDVSTNRPSITTLMVGGLRFNIMLENDTRSQYSCLSIAKVLECSKDKQISFDNCFIPPLINCRASDNLSDLLILTKDLLNQRALDLSGRISASASGSGGVAEVEDFLSLQLVNRFTQLMQHLIGLPRLHPELAYQHMIMLVGELASFSEKRIMPDLDGYRHDNIADTFSPLSNLIKDSLSSLSTKSRAFNIPLKEPKYGIYRAILADHQLIQSSTFVLTVKADIPSEELQRNFPNLVKISSIEKIRELIMVSLPGVSIKLLPYMPRELPYHDGFIPFELDRNCEAWQDLKNSSGMAIHIGDQVPGLKLQLWAIQR
jgi:type VI secretion system protein ImpJ